MKFYGIELRASELKNLRVESLASAPTENISTGHMYYDTTLGKLFIYVVDAWKDISKGDLSGDGITENEDGTLTLDLYDGTLTVDADGVRISTGGVDTTQLADAAVTAVKLNADVAGDGIVLDGTTNAIKANVDNSTLEIDPVAGIQIRQIHGGQF